MISDQRVFVVSVSSDLRDIGVRAARLAGWVPTHANDEPHAKDQAVVSETNSDEQLPHGFENILKQVGAVYVIPRASFSPQSFEQRVRELATKHGCHLIE